MVFKLLYAVSGLMKSRGRTGQANSVRGTQLEGMDHTQPYQCSVLKIQPKAMVSGDGHFILHFTTFQIIFLST